MTTLRYVLLILVAFLAAIVLSAYLRPGAVVVPSAAASTPYVWSPVAGLTPLPAVTSSLGSPSPAVKPSRATPASTRAPKPKPVVRPAIGGALRGTATWYDYVPGGAAAGYRLRAFLGPHWRGMTVQVCAGPRCVVVRLTDYMSSANHAKVVDLDDASFARLAPLGRGVIAVTVRRVK